MRSPLKNDKLIRLASWTLNNSNGHAFALMNSPKFNVYSLYRDVETLFDSRRKRGGVSNFSKGTRSAFPVPFFSFRIWKQKTDGDVLEPSKKKRKKLFNFCCYTITTYRCIVQVKEKSEETKEGSQREKCVLCKGAVPGAKCTEQKGRGQQPLHFSFLFP